MNRIQYSNITKISPARVCQRRGRKKQLKLIQIQALLWPQGWCSLPMRQWRMLYTRKERENPLLHHLSLNLREQQQVLQSLLLLLSLAGMPLLYFFLFFLQYQQPTLNFMFHVPQDLELDPMNQFLFKLCTLPLIMKML